MPVREPSSTHQADRHVGLRVRHLRRARGMSQQALGEALGLTFQQIQKYEWGLNRISASKLWEVSRVLQAPPGHFFEGLGGEAGDVGGGETGQNDLLRALLETPDAEALVLGYRAIRSTNVRKRLLALMGDLGEGDAGDS